MTLEIKTSSRVEKEVLITGLISLTIIQVAAFVMGVNGILFASILAVIAGIVGVSLPIKIK